MMNRFFPLKELIFLLTLQFTEPDHLKVMADFHLIINGSKLCTKLLVLISDQTHSHALIQMVLIRHSHQNVPVIVDKIHSILWD